MPTCSFCPNPAIVTIPTLTKTFSFCPHCITTPIPNELITEFTREMSIETFSFLLRQISESHSLKSTISTLQSQISAMESATKYNLLISTQKDRDSLLEENDQLAQSIIIKDEQIKIFQGQISNLQTETKKLAKSISSSEKMTEELSDHITNNADRIIALIKKQNPTFDLILDKLEAIKQQQTVKQIEEKPKAVKPKKPEFQPESQEISVDELNQATE